MNKRIWLAAVGGVALATGSALAAKEFSAWSSPVNVESLDGSSDQLNTASNDGCPILSPHDGSLFMASNRPGSVTNAAGTGPSLDIWIAPARGEGWADPVNAGSPINTAADEFCPTPARGNRFFFVRRLSPTNTDIYVVKKLPTGWTTPERLGPNVNSEAEEWSPSVYETADGTEVLYFATTRNSTTGLGGATATQDIYYSVNLGPAQPAQGGVQSASSDARPNVRRDGLEIVWDSTRAGGAPDIYSATRASVNVPWGAAVRLAVGADEINSPAGESRPSLSWDGTRLMFGTTRPGEGSADIYMSTREKVSGN